VEARGAGGDDDALQLMLRDVLLDHILARIRAGELEVPGDLDPREGFGELGEGGGLQNPCNVQATVTDVNSDSHRQDSG
jgi:hypothetical protein